MVSQSQHTGFWRTILFSDVCGSTKLYETLGNTRAQAVIAKTLGMLSRSATRHTGHIVKEIGDEVMCSFTSAEDAAQSAVDMQRSLQQAIASGEIDVKSLMIRIGIHCGPVVSQEADIFGDAVNVAARVAAHAKPGQILMTRETVGKLPEAVRGSVRFVGSTQVKGKEGLLELFDIVWEHENLTLLQNVAETRPSLVRLIAKLGDKTLEVGPQLPVLRMGRGTENEFIIADPLASRLHARIEFRRNRFVLIDQSLNGTYLRRQGMAEVALRRDEIGLEGSGVICLGKSTAIEREHCVRFRVRMGRPTGEAVPSGQPQGD
jgi:class 3 adenylate cyclase